MQRRRAAGGTPADDRDIHSDVLGHGCTVTTAIGMGLTGGWPRSRDRSGEIQRGEARAPDPALAASMPQRLKALAR
jgi:hypothetical protein